MQKMLAATFTANKSRSSEWNLAAESLQEIVLDYELPATPAKSSGSKPLSCPRSLQRSIFKNNLKIKLLTSLAYIW